MRKRINKSRKVRDQRAGQGKDAVSVLRFGFLDTTAPDGLPHAEVVPRKVKVLDAKTENFSGTKAGLGSKPNDGS